jgi:hypothetical protein
LSLGASEDVTISYFQELGAAAHSYPLAVLVNMYQVVPEVGTALSSTYFLVAGL